MSTQATRPIIDIHGHYTTEPKPLLDFRAAQLGAEGGNARLGVISDEEIRESIEKNQLRILRERGGDVMLFAPRASGMGHHVPDVAVADAWARESNTLVARVAELFPDSFAGFAQLPQVPDTERPGNLSGVITELRRTVEELGFVGCIVNPDPSGTWAGKPLTDESWFPLWEVVEELDVPAMIHVSTACNDNFHTLGAHYLNADTSVFMQLVEKTLFDRFPKLRFVIPHGGGAVPYHWGRYKGLAVRNEWPDPSTLLENVFFDSCVYHQPGMELLLKVMPQENVLFASEMLGAVRGDNPATGKGWDDTLLYVRGIDLSQEHLQALLTDNALRVYPRLAARLRERGVVAG